jgi:hypothetical protein
VLTLRAARISDAPDMYEVWYRAQPEPDKPAPSRDACRLGLFEHVVTSGDVLVATEDNRLMGFAALLERSGASTCRTCLWTLPDNRRGSDGGC